MANTTNFGWETPDDTDLVKDGAAAMRTLGNAIDTSLVDLKGGTTGQVLSKNTNTDMDFTWVTPNDADAIQNSIVDAKGDLIAASANDTPARLAVGNNGTVLTAASGETTGLKWALGGLTLISRTAFSNQASQAFDDVFTSTYDSYLVIIEELSAVTATNDLHLQLRYAGPTTQTAAYFSNAITANYSSATVTNNLVNSGAEVLLSTYCGDSGNPLSAEIFVNNVGNASQQPLGRFNSMESYEGTTCVGGFMTIQDRTYTGFLLKSSSSNITGTVAIYGIAK